MKGITALVTLIQGVVAMVTKGKWPFEGWNGYEEDRDDDDHDHDNDQTMMMIMMVVAHEGMKE